MTACVREECRGKYAPAVPGGFPTRKDLDVMQRLEDMAGALHGEVRRSNRQDGHRERVRGHRVRIRREWAIRRRLGTERGQ